MRSLLEDTESTKDLKSVEGQDVLEYESIQTLGDADLRQFPLREFEEVDVDVEVDVETWVDVY
jgi:hypothetical protein